jgi:hypothetical protein
MTLSDYIQTRTHGFLKRGAVGVEGDWLAIGELRVERGALCAVDPMLFDADDGVVARVAPGKYVLEGKVMDFDGDLRVSRLRAFRRGTEPALGGQVGKVGVDSGHVSVSDIEAAYDGLSYEAEQEFADQRAELQIEGGEIVEFAVGDKTVAIAVCESGFGDGSYPVFELRSGREVVGLEIEFLQDSFKRRSRVSS